MDSYSTISCLLLRDLGTLTSLSMVLLLWARGRAGGRAGGRARGRARVRYSTITIVRN